MEIEQPQIKEPEMPIERALKQHLRQSTVPAFSDNLFLRKIIADINRRQRAAFLRNLKIRLWTVAGFLAATLFVFAIALDASLKAFAQSPTYNFISLMFTDFGVVTRNWQDFGYSVLEALPLGAVVFVLAAFLASAVLGEYLIFQWNNFRKSLINS